jgi:hypothetical protein
MTEIRKIPSTQETVDLWKQQEAEKLLAEQERKRLLTYAMKPQGIVDPAINKFIAAVFPSQESQDAIDGAKPKGKRGRPKKEKVAKVKEELDDETDLKALVKCIKPFRGSPKDELNGVGLASIPKRNGEEGMVSFIYATNSKIGAIAFVEEETIIDDVARHSIVCSIPDASAKVILMPPEADQLMPINLDISYTTLVVVDDKYLIHFKDNDIYLDLESFLTWCEGKALGIIDCYKVELGPRRFVLYRETSWGGWATIALVLLDE